MKKAWSLIQPQSFPFYYGYVILIFGTIGVLASIPGQTIGVSTFTDPVKDALGLTRDQFSLAYGIGTFVSSLVLTHAGKLYDRYGVVITAVISILLLSATLVLCSYSLHISEGVFRLFNFRHWSIPFSLMIILFASLRFSGQGVLTMVSRNMVMKWFERLRGRINAISSISVSFGFSISPLIIDGIIQANGWQSAWRLLAASLLVVLVMILLFFKDNPEKYGLQPDGNLTQSSKNKQTQQAEINFTLPQAIRTRSFWMYALILSFQAFFVTGFTFHVVSIFAESGFERQDAIGIFLPITIVSTAVSLIGNIISDWIKLKALLYTMISGAIMATTGLIFLHFQSGYYLIMVGLGITGGLFAVLMAIVWPRYYGRQHLGAISGKAMSMLVMGSAAGPYLFSLSSTLTGQYGSISYLALAFLVMLAIGSAKANPPKKDVI